MINKLYNLIYKIKEYFIVSILIIISCILLILNDNNQIKQIRIISTIIFGKIQEPLNIIPSYFGLISENELLRKNNIILADEVNRLRDAKLENFRLYGLLEIKNQLPYKLTSAKIVNKNLLLERNTITLNVGLSDSVKPLMPVVTDNGLVGIVTNVSQNFAIVNLLINTDFKASAKIQRSRVDGIVTREARNLTIKNITKMKDVIEGDVVVTSEYSNTFPPNIKIGIVNDVQESQSSLFKSITITPSVDFVKLEEVFVVHFTKNTEREDLEKTSIPKEEKKK